MKITAQTRVRKATMWRIAAAPLSAIVLLCVAAATGMAGRSSAADPTGRYGQQTTEMVSVSISGHMPNGSSTNGVVSGDGHYARVIAFQSEASDLVAGDENNQEDVFEVTRGGRYNKNGGPWKPHATRLISRTGSGAPSNGPSFAPAVGGSLTSPPRCIAFLSAASNLVRGDTNGKIDAFVSLGPGGPPRRLTLPRNRQPRADATAVAVSGDCSRLAFVSGGRLYVRVKGRTRRVHAPGTAADPSFSSGVGNDLVFGARGGIYLARDATRRPQLIARGGHNAAYNDIKRHVVAYETRRAGSTQIAYKELGHRPRIITSRHGQPGNGSSRDPVIGNSGYYVTFSTDANNLTTSASGHAGDRNQYTDVYLYTDVRHTTLVQSVFSHGAPWRGQNPSMSFYANYILFDAPPFNGPDNAPEHQVFMRYLGPA